MTQEDEPYRGIVVGEPPRPRIDQKIVIRIFTFPDNGKKSAFKLSDEFAAHFNRELGGELPDDTQLSDLIFNTASSVVTRSLLDVYNIKISDAIAAGANNIGQLRNPQGPLKRILWSILGSRASYFMRDAFKPLPHPEQL